MIEYLLKWYRLILEGVFNVVSHKSLIKGSRYMWLVELMMIGILIPLLIILIRKSKEKKYILGLVLIFLLYTTYLFLTVNWKAFIKGGSYLGIQGRYLFPVLGSFIVVWAYSWIKLFNRKWISWLIIIITFIFLFWGEGYYIFKHYKRWCFDNVWLSSELGNAGEINKGNKSNKQVFNLKNEKKDVLGIGVYASTYSQEINEGFYLNLYINNCEKLIGSFPIKGIVDNRFFAVKFDKILDKNIEYCFDIENRNNDKPITVWYSGVDLSGQVIDESSQKQKDYIYDLLEDRLVKKYKLGQ